MTPFNSALLKHAVDGYSYGGFIEPIYIHLFECGYDYSLGRVVNFSVISHTTQWISRVFEKSKRFSTYRL